VDAAIGIVIEGGVIETVADEIEAAIAEARHPRFLHLRREHSNRVSHVSREAIQVLRARSK